MKYMIPASKSIIGCKLAPRKTTETTAMQKIMYFILNTGHLLSCCITGNCGDLMETMHRFRVASVRQEQG
jgi:hypothetical protein